MWCLEHMKRNAGGPMSWHSKWKAEAKLTDADDACKQHELMCRQLEFAVTYDQLNGGECVVLELAARQIQLIEDRHYEDTLSALVAAEEKAKGNKKDKSVSMAALSGEADHFMGTMTSKNNLCICPALTQHIAEVLKDEAAIQKERRKAREERAARS